MTPQGKTICLCMIVKNESQVIERCLSSILPLIDSWLIVDTGSTDGTQDLITNFLKTIPGELIEKPWRDFAYNRSEALKLARSQSNYSFIIDADDTITLPAGFTMPELDADSYTIDHKDTSITYRRTQIVSNRLPWCYKGVLHEFLTCEGAKSEGHLPLILNRNHDGARRRDSQTYHKDAAILKSALETETDSFLVSRYTFYLAQSYRDSNDPQNALQYYLRRAELGYWQEEVFVALLFAARMKERLDHPFDQVLSVYERASASCLSRAEGLHGASRLCRVKGRYAEGVVFAQRGLKIAKPTNALFMEEWIYDYGLHDELAVNAYWTGQYKESIEASLSILASGRCPVNQLVRTEDNLKFARQKLDEKNSDLSLKKYLKTAVYTIALNEAEHVERWVNSTAEADYRVVADTGSSDDTVARLKKAGVTVHRITISPWRFDDARNACLALVPSDADVCISLDMDEFLMKGWRTELESAWLPQTTRLFYNYARGFESDGTPSKIFRRGKIHSRSGYRWKRIVHEDLARFSPGEIQSDTPALIMGELQDAAKDRSSYLHMLKLAQEDDPHDSQICFWYARDLMYAGRNQESADMFIRYLELPTSRWADERSEAMRYLARVQPDQKFAWLQKAIALTNYRRELWLDLAEFFHSQLSWSDLYWACMSGATKCRITGTYLDETPAISYRLFDLGALACSHIGLFAKAVEWGEQALQLKPDDQRLLSNLNFYKSQLGAQIQKQKNSRLGGSIVLKSIENEINSNHQKISLDNYSLRNEDIKVCCVAIPDHVHAAALAEIAEIVVSGLQHLGHGVEFSADPNQAENSNIIIGGHLLSPDHCINIPSDAIIYNTEHVNSDFFRAGSTYFLQHYIDLLKKSRVWDYSTDNSELLKSLLGIEAKYVPLGYVPTLTKIEKEQEDIDVLFYGSPCERRQAVLNDLKARGLIVQSVFGVYGKERDALIARAKVVLNIHKNMPGTFEIVRVAHLLSNFKAVVAEVNVGEHFDEDLRGGFADSSYERLADTAADLIIDTSRRKGLELEGFKKFSARNASLILRDALKFSNN